MTFWTGLTAPQASQSHQRHCPMPITGARERASRYARTMIFRTYGSIPSATARLTLLRAYIVSINALIFG